MKTNTLIVFTVMILAQAVSPFQAFGSAKTETDRRFFETERMYPDDRFIITLFTDIWQNAPQNMDLKTIQRGITISAMQDMPLGRSNFSVAAGLGFSSHNLYSDHLYLFNHSENKFDFHPISSDHQYDNNKISLNYIEIPVQLRYRSRTLPKTFRVYAGMKAGRIINAHTKFVGKEYYHYQHESPVITERTVKIKEHKLRNINDYRIGLTATIGYGMVNLHAFYPLTNIFTENSAEEMKPLSLGVSFIVF